MKIKVFKSNYLTELQQPKKIIEELNSYHSGIFEPVPIDSETETRVVMDETPILSSVKADAFENAVKLHQSLVNMDRITASDQRLWAWLARGPFAKYMAARWAKESAWNKISERRKIVRVLKHWFVQNQKSRNYYDHGLAYYWWGVEMTKGSERDNDPYQLTREFFSTQEYTRQLAGKLGQSSSVLRAVLRFVIQNPRKFSIGKDNMIRKLGPRLNMVAAYKRLTSMTDESIQSILGEITKDF